MLLQGHRKETGSTIHIVGIDHTDTTRLFDRMDYAHELCRVSWQILGIQERRHILLVIVLVLVLFRNF